MKRKRGLLGLFERLKLSNKFLLIYVCCLIIPLIITDSIVLYSLLRAEMNDLRHDRESEATAYQNVLFSSFELDTRIGVSSYNNNGLNDFLNQYYPTGYDYYSAYTTYMNDSFFKTINSLNSDQIVIFSNNSSIIDGGNFHNIDTIRDTEWFSVYKERGLDETVMVFYDDSPTTRFDDRRNIYYIRRLNRLNRNAQRYFVVRKDTYALAKSLKDLPYDNPMYICSGDYVVFSNCGDNMSFDVVQKRIDEDKNYTLKDFKYKGCELQIYVFNDDIRLLEVMRNRMSSILVLLVITLVLPLAIMRMIERSITDRIKSLQQAFKGDETGTFIPIKEVNGSDEIAGLMTDYNKIVDINNELIKTVYVEKLREQEIDIARKNAELLALQNQINPHFLFNALESIRMHSMLRGENETAEMVQKLAVMERQNVDWQNDNITVDDEMEFVVAYLALQNYRFGERLTYDIDIEEECRKVLIPKLTLTTFVENACVHGIESKSSQGWIFIRIYRENSKIFIEVEDTGDGMDEDKCREFAYQMNNVDIDMIKNQTHVGSLNACLRMRMLFEDKVRFEIESEEGVGFTMIVQIDEDAVTYGD